jgi:hypothetical protein
VESVWQRADSPAESPATKMTPDSSKRPTLMGIERAFLWWVGLLALVLLALLHESILGGKGLVPANGIFSFPPWQETGGASNWLLEDQYCVFVPGHAFVHQQFLRGCFPLWNPGIACGVPNLASLQGALLFPINLLLLPLDPFYAAGPAAFLKLLLAGWFTMLYLRLLGASNSGAFLSGLVFSLSGFMIVWLGHPHVNSAMWLPLLLYWIERAFRAGHPDRPGGGNTPALRMWIGFAVTYGCMLLGGHPPTMVHVTLVVGIYFLFRWIAHWREQPWLPAGLGLGALLAGFLLAAPALVPFLEYYHYSSGELSSQVLQRSANHLPFNTLILFLFPHLSGSPVAGFEETMLRLGIGKLLPNFNERTGYVGVLPLLFALYAVVGRRCRWTVFYAFTALVSLLIVYGLPPLPALLKLLPVLRDISPTRLLMVAGFSLAVLAGLGWDAFQRSENRRLKYWVVAGFWVAVGAVLLGYGHQVAPRWNDLDAAHRSFLQPQFFMLAGALAASGALLLRSLQRQPALGAAIVLGWVAVDLLVFGRGYNPAISRNDYYPATPAIQWLQQDPGGFRVWGEKAVLIPNTAEVFGLRDARGCDFMTVRRYEELINGRAGEFFFYNRGLGLPKPLQLLNVKYVLDFRPAAPDPARFELVYSNEISIYRNRAFRERALAVFDYRVERDPAAMLDQVRSGAFDPAHVLLLEEEPNLVQARSEMQTPMAGANATVRIVADEPDEVRVEASLPRPGFLLLLDTWFPGWSATVNGLPAHLYRADYNFRAVQLPAGNSTLQFAYRPGSFRLGLVLCIVGVLVLAAAWFRPWKKRSAGTNVASAGTDALSEQR